MDSIWRDASSPERLCCLEVTRRCSLQPIPAQSVHTSSVLNSETCKGRTNELGTASTPFNCVKLEMQKLLGTKTPFCQILFDTYHSEILWDLAQWPKMIVTASWGVPHWRLQALINSYQTRAHFKRALRVQGPWCCVAGLLASFGLE